MENQAILPRGCHCSTLELVTLELEVFFVPAVPGNASQPTPDPTAANSCGR